MNGKRKIVMFFGQLVVAAGLALAGKLSGAEFVSLQTMAFPIVVLGNFGEHFMKKGAGNVQNPPASV